MVNISDVCEEEFVYPGTRSCAGCSMALILRITLKALGPKTILTIPASCSTVQTGMQGFCATKVSVLNTPFASAGASAAGIIASLESKGLEKAITVMAFAGDGGTTDIGIQALSGAAERGTNFIYLCYDNEAYMNTGVQRSGSTPLGAFTTTTPRGKVEHKKNMPKILEAHGIPYIATANAAYPMDLYEKLQKARDIKGTKYFHVLSPCPPGWGFEPRYMIKIGKLANQTGFWPLYEVVYGKFNLSKDSKKFLDSTKRKPIEEYLNAQKRFKNVNNEIIKQYNLYLEAQWKEIKKRLED